MIIYFHKYYHKRNFFLGYSKKKESAWFFPLRNELDADGPIGNFQVDFKRFM